MSSGIRRILAPKPNELSGGQKQRVVIARALVKEPKLILADEPTGNLDQETGRQLFDVLIKLSQDILIIVVSHDRELAETYGDRIIELEDGKIITDVKRSVFETKRPIKVVDYHTIQVKDGYRLTLDDLNKINEQLEKMQTATQSTPEHFEDAFNNQESSDRDLSKQRSID